MKNQRRIEIGDVLVVSNATEDRYSVYNSVPEGTRLVVTGFNTFFRGRVGEFGRKPGMYSFNDSPTTIREDNGEMVSINKYHLRFEDGSGILMDIEGVWLEDLPSLPFWEGDTVCASRDIFGHGTNNVVITKIAYNDIYTKCGDGDAEYSIYTISPSMLAGVSTSAKESELSLVERGNVWKYYHDEPLHFDSVADEAQFYNDQLGRTQDVRNEATGMFSWTIEEAVNAVREGKGDSISVSPSLFGIKQHPYVNKFLDEGVGARVREATLQGWTDFDPAKFADEIAEELRHRKEKKGRNIAQQR